MTVKTPPELLDDRDLRHIRRYLKVTSGEIADLAGKDPSAVTHWRKGKKGFPEPVVGGRSPLFRYDEAHDWLKEHNKLAHEPDPAWLWRKSVQALHESTGVADRSRLRGYVTTMVVVVPDFTNDLDDFVELRETEGFDRWRDETGRDLDTETEKFLGQHINEVKPHGETLKCAARALRYALRKQCAEWELLDCALGALDALSPVQTTTSLPVADLITELIGNLAGQAWTVADLACGEATLITGLLKRDLPSDARFVGVEKDRDTAAIARIRLMLRSSSTTADIQVGDSLAEATTAGLFDAVVIDPPTKKTKAWLDLARKSLATNQTSRAFVLLPKSALVADGPCASLTRERRLEAVVYLPNRLKKDSRGLALCVITSESVRCEETLLIDLADLKVKNPYSGPLTQLSDPIRDVLPINDVSAAVSHWQTTRTINRDLLRGRQESITADNAIKRGLGSHSRLLPDDSHANSDRHGTAQRSLLEGANLVGADLKGKNLEGADLEGANLVGADLEGANLKGANLEQANLVGANLEGANLEQANLVGADLVGADLKGKNLVWAHLEGANLERADLRGASLEGAYLERADLHWADLEGANLKGADLEGANLKGANLKGAKLKGANLGGADLEGANLERADLRGAEADEQTTWPKGFDPQAAEVIFED